MKIAIVGGGISGLSVGKMLHANGFVVDLFEQKDQIGGLVNCTIEDGNLFHRVGGHVFNTKNDEISKWFWDLFDQENDFVKTRRNAKILMDQKIIGYPLENYLYELDSEIGSEIIKEILSLFQNQESLHKPTNFEDFLKTNFGSKLYKLYFEPYNKKIWKTNLADIDLDWLEGKLPMPDYTEIILNNIFRKGEEKMVHSTFYYPKEGGSQFIAEKIASGLNIYLNSGITTIKKVGNKWHLNELGEYELVIYTADIRSLNKSHNNFSKEMISALENTLDFKSTGTSNVLCYTDPTDISWLYLPNENVKAHRIIYTGNFSEKNNSPLQRKTCTIEFSGKVSKEDILADLGNLPGNLSPISYNYEPNSYVIQDHSTRMKVIEVKNAFKKDNFFFLGRFAEWEYYNMDKAMEASLSLFHEISSFKK